jgi:nucleolin
MLSQKQVILLLTAQSAALLASAFVAPTPFGVKSLLQSKSAGPLFSDVVSAVASTSEDEAAESVVEPTEESSDTSEPAADATPAEEKQRLTVFVGNLPFQTTDSEVRDLFAEYGTVELVSVPRNRETGQARGFAFVDMATREELERAVEGVNGIMFGGRSIRAVESLPKEQVKKQSKKAEESEDGLRKIYVGNLSFDADKESLFEFYSQYGNVKDVYVPLDTESGRARGFAFVTIDEDDADKAIEATNGQTFMGRQLAVSVPLPRGEKAPARADTRQRTKLYVGNLSFYTTLDTVEEFFAQYGEVHDAYMPEDGETGGSRGFAFVTMDNEGAQTAIEETDGYELDGRIIRVNEAQPREKPRRDDFYDDDGDDGDYDDSEY